ncbi:MAG: RagB/SusD family nutrient uptake outer membrane protein, partial [Bacteroidota bacterium]|nr:RagB/SusD family nutrient uptake outer membrane protein [Bacteroidota bacterium]
MKKFNYILICLVITSFVMVSCNGLLDADSERYTFDENYQMSSDHDSLYAMVGILSQLQKLGDRYVLLGELRGDLMQTNDEASLYLKQINEFNISKDNPYTSTKEYYSIINNCNYTIQYVDTAKVKNAEKPMLRVMAAAKAIRAWTYLQLVLNYGSAKYIDRPILTSTDAEMTYPVYNLSQLADALIEDLLPFKDVEPLQLGVFAEYNSNLSMLPIKFLLGDLYLWKGDYEHAANMYYELMYAKSLVIKKDYMNYWEYSDKFVKTILHIDWKNTFKAGSTEVLAALSSSPDYGSPFTL